MGNKVFANGREIACKAGSGQSIAAFPDVCLSPPTPPAGPVPVPYPLTAGDSDTNDGSKTVKISGKEVMLKSDSNFKKCTGDEAATKSLGMGVITHNITGKVYFCAWSMDVKIEGANAVRHLDMVTHNHMSQTGQTPPWPFMESMSSAGNTDPCKKEKNKVEKACKGKKDKKDRCPPHNPPAEPAGRPSRGDYPKSAAGKRAFKAATDKYKASKAYKKWRKDTKAYYNRRARENAKDPCMRAMRCMLVKWNPSGCCPGQTPHHLIEKASFKGVPGTSSYNADDAPCICVEGNSWHTGSHAMMHTMQGNLTEKQMARNAKNKTTKAGNVTLKQAKKTASKSVKKVFPESGCSAKCIEAQLQKGHEPMKDDKEIKGAPCGNTSDEAVKAVERRVEQKLDSLKGRNGGAGGSA